MDGQLDESLALYYGHLSDTVRLLAGADGAAHLARVVSQHLIKQRAYDEYVRLAAACHEVPMDRRLLIECFQGADLRYGEASVASSMIPAASPLSSPSIGPGL